MPSPWLHRYAAFVAVCVLLLVATGGSDATSSLALFDLYHRVAAAIVGVLTLGLAIWLSVDDQRAWMRRLGWIVFAVALADGGLGALAARISHACLALLFFSATVAIVVFTSGGWLRGPEPVQDQGWPSMRSLAIITPALVLIQALLGAGFRHKALGVMPHILGAMIVALVVLVVCMFAMQQFPTHSTLRPAAITLLVLTLAQVALGITVITIQMVNPKITPPVVVSTVAHVAMGAMTFAASMVLAIQIRRNVRGAA